MNFFFLLDKDTDEVNFFWFDYWDKIPNVKYVPRTCEIEIAKTEYARAYTAASAVEGLTEDHPEAYDLYYRHSDLVDAVPWAIDDYVKRNGPIPLGRSSERFVL